MQRNKIVYVSLFTLSVGFTLITIGAKTTATDTEYLIRTSSNIVKNALLPETTADETAHMSPLPLKTTIVPKTQNKIKQTASAINNFIPLAHAAGSAPATPTKITISSVGINAPVIPTGLESNGELHVPSNTTQAGWYKYGTFPGQTGSAVITAHLNYGKNFTPGVFANLHNAKVGDSIKITDAAGSVYAYTINKMDYVSQNAFPTNEVYGKIDYPGLRLISCAGVYDKSTHRYTQDLIVYATLTDVQN